MEARFFYCTPTKSERMDITQELKIIAGGYVYSAIAFVAFALIASHVLFSGWSLMRALIVTGMVVGAMALAYWYGDEIYYKIFGGSAALEKAAEKVAKTELCNSLPAVKQVICNTPAISFLGGVPNDICKQLGCSDAACAQIPTECPSAS